MLRNPAVVYRETVYPIVKKVLFSTVLFSSLLIFASCDLDQSTGVENDQTSISAESAPLRNTSSTPYVTTTNASSEGAIGATWHTGTYGDLNAYSCGGNTYYSYWQCVELYRRWVETNLGLTYHPGNATDLGDAIGNDSAYTVYRNGSTTKPVPGDALIWSAGTFGHVAIVTSVNGNTINYIQQNDWWGNAFHPTGYCTWYGSRFSPTNDNTDSSMYGKCWIHPKKIGSGGVGAVVTSPETYSGYNILSNGQSLPTGKYLLSPWGLYRLVNQYDGNVVLYQNGSNVALWASNTAGKATTNLVMQSDGNLVLYNGTSPVWASNTSGKGNSYFRMQDDGNAVIYKCNTTPAVSTWATNTNNNSVLQPGASLARGASLTSINKTYRFNHQADGNVVLYHDTNAIWATNTNGRATTSLNMQTDGNLVLYNGSAVVWASNTDKQGYSELVIQNDGNAVIYKINNESATWASGTSGK
jgi:hypothetical protein